VRSPAARSGAASIVTGALAVLARPDVARGCTVCFGGQDGDWNFGFLLGTAMMLALPPAVVIGAGVAIYRSMKRQEARLQERDAQAASQSGTR
jgi:hypothetical protein